MAKKVTYLDGESFEYDCPTCKDQEQPGGSACPDCCEHEFDPDEGFHCLECGTDGSEDVMAAAYDRAKDARKYGEE